MKKLFAVFSLFMILIIGAGCGPTNKGQIGGLTGATLGGTAGYFLLKNKVGGLAGAAIGAGAGMILGYIGGNELDKYDLNNMQLALEKQPTGIPLTWQNPNNGIGYQAIPQAPIMQYNGAVARDIEIITTTGEHLYVRAYRQYDGSWRMAQNQ